MGRVPCVGEAAAVREHLYSSVSLELRLQCQYDACDVRPNVLVRKRTHHADHRR